MCTAAESIASSKKKSGRISEPREEEESLLSQVINQLHKTLVEQLLWNISLMHISFLLHFTEKVLLNIYIYIYRTIKLVLVLLLLDV